MGKKDLKLNKNDMEKIIRLTKEFSNEYQNKLKKYGFYMSTGFSYSPKDKNTSLEVRLVPIKDSTGQMIPDPALFDWVKLGVLPSEYSGRKVNVRYVGEITPYLLKGEQNE